VCVSATKTSEHEKRLTFANLTPDLVESFADTYQYKYYDDNAVETGTILVTTAPADSTQEWVSEMMNRAEEAERNEELKKR
jgi:hypothetical protein